MNKALLAKSIASLLTLLVGLGGLGTFGYTITQQAKIQSQMNLTMTQVNQSVAKTTGLVAHTSQILKPLDSTTAGLAAIEQQEQAVVGHLNGMNHSLAVLATTEQNIVVHLSTLNQVTQNVADNLQTIGGTNAQTLAASQHTVTQAESEAGSLRELNGMTSTATGHLTAINHRLAALKLLP